MNWYPLVVLREIRDNGGTAQHAAAQDRGFDRRWVTTQMKGTPMHRTNVGIDRRTLLLATGAAGIAAAIGRSAGAQEAPSGSARVGVSEDGYRTDERANIGFFPLNTNIFEALVYLTPDYQIEPRLAESWEFVESGAWRIVLR